MLIRHWLFCILVMIPQFSIWYFCIFSSCCLFFYIESINSKFVKLAICVHVVAFSKRPVRSKVWNNHEKMKRGNKIHAKSWANTTFLKSVHSGSKSYILVCSLIVRFLHKKLQTLVRSRNIRHLENQDLSCRLHSNI